MEVDQIQCNLHTFINANATLTSSKQSHHPKMDSHYPDDKEEDGDRQQIPPPPVHLRGGVGSFYGWPSSRIVRVTRASGGKDRHSKVLTSKGLRDRRVRLSVNTAIQFYDLQDRLGYDQPSKALEWLLKAAATSIAELPPMNPPFPETPKQLSDEKRSSTGGSDEVGLDATADTGGQPPTYLTKSSSNSETSKPSGVSRSEHRMKARERARESAAEKDKDKDESEVHPNSQITSFTELLSGGGFNRETSNRQWSDYLTPQMQLLNSLKRNPFTLTGYFNSELQNLEFGMVNGDDENNGSYNLTFGISSAGVAGFNRGTLQSNSTSSSLLPPAPIVQTHHAHRFGSSSSSTGLLMGENQQPHEFQLFYAGQKGKGKD